MGNLTDSLNKYNLLFKGKVRNIYDYGDDRLLIYTSDRISAFDYVFKDEVPGKGVLLTKMAKFWFNKTNHIIQNHILDEQLDIPENIQKNCMLVTKTKVLPIEAIVRGHLAGSAWSTYESIGKVNNIEMVNSYKKYDKFNEPIFTPSTKAEIGDKDENISIEQMQGIIGVNLTEKIQRISIELFKFAYNFAKERGVIIADTKFEFGLDKDNKLVLIDEIFTPDCSRFWLYKNNKIDYKSFDKQFFRDYLTSIKWNNNQIQLPEDIKNSLLEKYQVAYNLITI
ncbi:phosphoribosylaminoimidazolesuccinocarboxamide synthase [Gammaproteobacteria bacterium]|nr:phosphoribosylaminoimidazolesuccinocarboxamide synthase [Gammaproteobacteria bacterium]